MKEMSREQRHVGGIVDKDLISKLEYENKFLRDSLKVSTIIVSILTSILTTIILAKVRG